MYDNGYKLVTGREVLSCKNEQKEILMSLLYSVQALSTL